MAVKLSRRKALAVGLASGGFYSGYAHAQKSREKYRPYKWGSGWQGTGWSRGPDRELIKDLKPGPTPIRLACSSQETRLNYPPVNMSITEAVKKIRGMGYTSVGVSHGPGRRNKWLDATEADIRELKEALKTYDVVFFDHMTYDNIIHPDSRIRNENIRHVTENVEAAEKCGALSVCAGFGTRDTEFALSMHPDNWTAATWKLGVDGVKQILRDTAGYKAVLGMEPVVTTPLDGPEALKRCIEDVGDPRCKITLDCTNMFTVANYYHSTEMLNWSFDLLGEDIISCHAKDTFIERDKMLVIMSMKPAGQGMQDYETYLVRMSRMKWPRTLLLEFAQPEEYPVAKAFVESTAAKIGVKMYG
ncbi:MAG: sugar phosphate isomerase/epimerase family protein [Candidatus Latescibacterota bacterium]